MLSFYRFLLVVLLITSSVYIVSNASAVPMAVVGAGSGFDNKTEALNDGMEGEASSSYQRTDLIDLDVADLDAVALDTLELGTPKIEAINAVKVIDQTQPNGPVLADNQTEQREIDLSGFPPCDSPACRSVAVDEAWPVPLKDATQEKMVKFNYRGFNMSVPETALKTRENNAFCQFDFDDKRWISMTIFERSDMDEFFKSSHYTMSDWANIVFTQTPDSQKPTTENEAYAWYSSLMNKVAFVGGNMVVHYKNLPIEVYTIDDFYTGKIIFMIVSHELPNVLLKMEAYGFGSDAIKQLIAGIEK